MNFFYKIILLSVSFTSLTFAATDGTLGTTSTGTVDVSITIPGLVQITGLSDIALGTPGSFPATGNTSACIYSNVALPLGSYFVTATSANQDSGNFRVTDGSNFIVYSAFWNNTSAASQTTAFTSGTKTAQQTGGDALSLTCGGGANANFNVSFSAAQVASAPAATYSDTVTILISPT